MNKVTFSERLKEARKVAKLSQEALAKKVGRTKSTISRWESGERNPQMLELVELEKALGVSAHMLMYGSDEIKKTTLSEINRISSQLEESRQEKVLMFAESELEEQRKENTTDIREFIYNYYDNAVSAGTGEYLADGKPETVTLPVDFEADFVCPVSGDSMEPEYHDGDYVFVKLSYDITDGDIGVFILDGDAYIKELRVDEEGAFLHSLNPQYRDKPITPESNFRIVGEVVGRYNEKD